MFGINLNLPSAATYFVMGYNYVHKMVHWLMYNYNLLLIIQSIGLLFGIKVLFKVLSMGKMYKVKKTPYCPILLIIQYTVLQFMYLCCNYILIYYPQTHMSLFYSLLYVSYIVGISTNYLLPRFLHDLLGINKKRNRVFLIYTVLFYLWFFIDSPLFFHNGKVISSCTPMKLILFSILGFLYDFYFIFTSVRRRKGATPFVKHMSLFIIIIFSLSIIVDFGFMMTYRDDVFVFSIQNLSLTTVVTTLFFFIVNSVFYYGYSKLYQNEEKAENIYKVSYVNN